MLTNANEFMLLIDKIIHKGKFNATYKLALLIAIAQACHDKKPNENQTLFIAYQELAEHFIRIYWHSTNPYHKKDGEKIILRHGINTGEDKITHFLQEYQNLTNAHQLKDIDDKNKHYQEAVKEIAKLIKNNPAKYLQTTDSQYDANALYEYGKHKDGIELNAGCAWYFCQHKTAIVQQCKNRMIDVIIANPKNNLHNEKFDRSQFVIDY